MLEIELMLIHICTATWNLADKNIIVIPFDPIGMPYYSPPAFSVGKYGELDLKHSLADFCPGLYNVQNSLVSKCRIPIKFLLIRDSYNYAQHIWEDWVVIIVVTMSDICVKQLFLLWDDPRKRISPKWKFVSRKLHFWRGRSYIFSYMGHVDVFSYMGHVDVPIRINLPE